MRNEFYFQFYVTQEQIDYTNRIVDYSLDHHPVSDIFANDPDGKKRQREFRFTGSLGEVVFADAYGLPRPTRSYGAVDGQDFGQDFSMSVNEQVISFDVKSMGRKDNKFRENYVLNLPAYQVHKSASITDCYFCISFHNDGIRTVATFVGYIDKQEVIDGKIGNLFVAGTERIKDDGGSFIFQRDTYEVEFKDIRTPMINDNIKSFDGFRVMKILPPFKK